MEENDVMGVVEGFLIKVFDTILNQKISAPFRRMSYDEAMNSYGSDKPDLRYDLHLEDLGEIFKASSFKVFTQALDAGSVIKGFSVPGAGKFSRKDFDDLTNFVKDFGAQGLVWFKVGDNGSVESPIKKFLSDTEVKQLLEKTKATSGDAIFMIAAPWLVTCRALGALRLELVRRLQITPKNQFELLWVVDFPLFEWNEDEKRYQACHHPFTSPRKEDLDLIESNPAEAKARAYDLVLNGTEIGGGSIRIYQEQVQEKMFAALGISKEEAKSRFGFLLEALQFGAPPHGGIALGLDRLTAVILGLESIREVIAFPKTQKGICPLVNAPSGVSAQQLKELNLSVRA